MTNETTWGGSGKLDEKRLSKRNPENLSLL